MSVEILDKTNTKAPRLILIDENYCLNDSFDIIQTNFKTLLQDLNQINDTFFPKTVIDRYNKNKIKYQQFLTLVEQFSGNWTSALKTYNRYKNIWDNLIAPIPLEIVYPEIVNITSWGVYNNNIITENTAQSLILKTDMLNWVNSKYPIEIYGKYKNLYIRLYIYDTVSDVFDFNVQYKEMCEPGGGGSACCTPCTPDFGNKGCNHAIVKGHGTCANMFDWCPGSSEKVEGFSKSHGGSSHDEKVTRKKSIASQTYCETGSCKGRAEEGPSPFTGRNMEIKGSLTGVDTRIIGYQIIKLKYDSNIDKKWVKI